MVNVFDTPVQLKVSSLLVNTGVTVMLAVMGDDVAFVAVNDAIFPLPFDARPIPVLLLDQLKVIIPPEFGLLKFIAAVDALLHKV